MLPPIVQINQHGTWLLVRFDKDRLVKPFSPIPFLLNAVKRLADGIFDLAFIERVGKSPVIFTDDFSNLLLGEIELLNQVTRPVENLAVAVAFLGWLEAGGIGFGPANRFILCGVKVMVVCVTAIANWRR